LYLFDDPIFVGIVAAAGEVQMAMGSFALAFPDVENFVVSGIYQLIDIISIHADMVLSC
jgi:hypothetical protein